MKRDGFFKKRESVVFLNAALVDERNPLVCTKDLTINERDVRLASRVSLGAFEGAAAIVEFPSVRERVITAEVGVPLLDSRERSVVTEVTLVAFAATRLFMTDRLGLLQATASKDVVPSREARNLFRNVRARVRSLRHPDLW
jgi:hypothetical protein